jgi:uncharacterized protein DUF4386
MSSTRNPGRVAGFLYLLLALAGPVRLIYIPSKLFVHGDATATSNNIAAHETLFRLGIASDLFVGTIVIFVAFALYLLFKEVDHNLAVLMVILGGLMPAAIYFCNVLNDAAALTLVHGANFLFAFEKPQRDALVMLFLHLHGQGFVAGEIFYGLWLIPLGLLTYRSHFLPPLPGRLADHQRPRLSGPQLYRRTVTAIRGSRLQHHLSLPHRRGRIHAVASN